MVQQAGHIPKRYVKMEFDSIFYYLIHSSFLASRRILHSCLTFTGFRSCVKYFSVLNPTEISSYISEVLDAGLLGPLFKVRLPLVCLLWG